MAKILVIAASSTIGQKVVQILQNSDHEVITTARNTEKIKPDYELDATNFDAVDHVFKAAGDIDAVVNFSGSLLLKSAHTTSEQEFDETINASLKTAFATVRAAGKHMKKGGSVVLISSAVALEGLANHEAIAAAKAGVVGLMRAAAATYAGNNLRCNAVAPGMTQTALTEKLLTNEMAKNVSQAMHALGRLGEPKDIANAVVFLLNPENDWITGQVIGVDGGLRVFP